MVTKKWRHHSKEGIDYYLAGKKNYIVAKIDVRGTSFSGKDKLQIFRGGQKTKKKIS